MAGAGTLARPERGAGTDNALRDLRYRWRFELAASPEELWPLAADTNRFNRDTGLPAVERLSAGENARRRLRLRRFGVPLEWEEEPFEWERPRRFGVRRRYLRGPLAELDIRVQLEPREGTGTTVVYDVRARPRNWLGLLGTPIELGLRARRRFGRAFREYDRRARGGLPRGSPRLAPSGRERLAAAERALLEAGRDRALVDRLVAHVERGDEFELARIRPYALADAWRSERRAVLELCLHATRAGLLELRWELLCPSCRGSAETTGTLGEVRRGVHCDTCGIDFEVGFDRSVELTFRPSPAVRRLEGEEFCVGGPQVRPHVVVQQLLAPGEERTVTPALEPGGYRLHALGEEGGEELVVAPGEPATITLENDTPRERLFLLERTAWRDQAATAADVAALQAFRDLFAEEALRPGEPISVGTLTVAFTDLRDSTRYYRRVGDAPAFGSVLEHLDVLRQAVAVEEGAVVKTMGDAIMAVFTRPVGAVRAMLEAQALVAGRPLALKAGVHTGPCIAVNQNGVLDYFGSTVNLAARLAALSSGEDVVVSGPVLADPEVAALGLEAEPLQATVKGFEEEAFELWRVRV